MPTHTPVPADRRELMPRAQSPHYLPAPRPPLEGGCAAHFPTHPLGCRLYHALAAPGSHGADAPPPPLSPAYPCTSPPHPSDVALPPPERRDAAGAIVTLRRACGHLGCQGRTMLLPPPQAPRPCNAACGYHDQGLGKSGGVRDHMSVGTGPQHARRSMGFDVEGCFQP